MKYYVTADIHGFYSQFHQALEEKGFFSDTTPHKLIICGDLFDRGKEAKEIQQFVLDLMKKDEVILICGNHEDLMLDLLNKWDRFSFLENHHISNGTVNTVLQLTDCLEKDLFSNPEEVGKKLLQTPFIQKIIPSMLDYYETKNYIFVHGWIPCTKITLSKFRKEYIILPDWRNANEKQWEEARWINGMEAAYEGCIVSNKTIVCGHWHTSFGHSHYQGQGEEFGNKADYTPYTNNGIIALDACTVVSNFVNCIVIEDKEI